MTPHVRSSAKSKERVELAAATAAAAAAAADRLPKMGKSIRSKIKKKFRTIKRNIVAPFYTEKLKECLEDAPLPVRPEETPESHARRNDPRKKDTRLGCAAFALAFPGGVTGDENRRMGVGNWPSCPPVELEKKKQAEIDEYNRNQRAEYDEGRRQAKLERERLESMKMAVEGPEKTIKKKRKLKGGRSKSDSSYKRSN